MTASFSDVSGVHRFLAILAIALSIAGWLLTASAVLTGVIA